MNRQAQFINPLLECPVSVLRIIAFIDPIRRKPFIKKRGSATGDVSEIVGITGDAEKDYQSGGDKSGVPIDRIS
jgi:CheY-specific phosphatase CheX